MFSTPVANAQCLRAFARHIANNAYLSKVDFAKLKISFLQKILTESDYKFGKGDLLDSVNLKIYISFLTTDTAKKLQKKPQLFQYQLG